MKTPTKKQMLQRQAVYNAIAIAASIPAAAADTGVVMHDRVSVANASLFDSSHLSEALTNYAVGYRDTSGLDEALEFFAPGVPVPRKFEYLTFDNEDAFEADTDDERAIGEDFKLVKQNGKLELGKTANRGLKIIVDEDEVDGDPNWKERKVTQLLMRIKRNKLIRAIGMLRAAAVNTAVTWDASAGKDPDMDATDMLIRGADQSGMMANRVGYGHTAWAKRIKSHRAQDSAGGAASAGLTLDQLADFLAVDEAFIAKSRVQNGASKDQILSNEVFSFLAQSGLGTEDPSNIKGFYTMLDGGQYRVYEERIGSKFTAITVEHYDLTKITSLLGIEKLTVS